jgi:hypothetical protein
MHDKEWVEKADKASGLLVTRFGELWLDGHADEVHGARAMALEGDGAESESKSILSGYFCRRI